MIYIVDIYSFIKIDNSERQSCIGLLLLKNEINENTDIKELLLFKINKCSFMRELGLLLKLNYGNNTFKLIENEDSGNDKLFSYHFNILMYSQISNIDNNVEQTDNNNINQNSHYINNCHHKNRKFNNILSPNNIHFK